MKRNKHLNGFYYVGIVALILTLTLSEFFSIPDAIRGFGMGFSISMLLYSIFVQTRSYQKFKTFKKELFNKQNN